MSDGACVRLGHFRSHFTVMYSNSRDEFYFKYYFLLSIWSIINWCFHYHLAEDSGVSISSQIAWLLVTSCFDLSPGFLWFFSFLICEMWPDISKVTSDYKILGWIVACSLFLLNPVKRLHVRKTPPISLSPSYVPNRIVNCMVVHLFMQWTGWWEFKSRRMCNPFPRELTFSF